MTERIGYAPSPTQIPAEQAMTTASRLEKLTEHSVAVWFDSISRERLASGGLAMPEATLHATQDHGTISGDSITGHFDDSAQVLAELRSVGVDHDDVVERLERQGVSKFVDAWNHLLEHLDQSTKAARRG